MGGPAPTIESPAPPSAEEHARRRRRRRLLGWLPTALMLATLAALAAGTVAFQNSWWLEERPEASSDQLAPNGTSTFTPAGLDYINRTHWAAIDLREDRPATGLGLPRDATTDIRPLIPVQLIVVGEDGVAVEYVDSFSIQTREGRVVRVTAHSAATYGYRSLIAHVKDSGGRYGWTVADVDEFHSRLAARASDSPREYSATARGTELGLSVTAEISVSVERGQVDLFWRFAPLR